MQPLHLSVRLLGRALWTALFEVMSFEAAQKDVFLLKLHTLESLRTRADYDTGSICTISAWSLFAATRNFLPEVTLEVGTFIGKSTISMGLGMDFGKRHGTIHTCDLSNDIPLPALCKTTIVQYTKKSSSQMIAEMLSKNMAGTVDFVHLDGRLSDQDMQPLATLCKPETVFAFDDFEGIEKGTANYSKMVQSTLFQGRTLVPPCSEEISRQFGFLDTSRTALWIPTNLIKITAQ